MFIEFSDLLYNSNIFESFLEFKTHDGKFMLLAYFKDQYRPPINESFENEESLHKRYNEIKNILQRAYD
jgi:hypothetical protein